MNIEEQAAQIMRVFHPDEILDAVRQWGQGLENCGDNPVHPLITALWKQHKDARVMNAILTEVTLLVATQRERTAIHDMLMQQASDAMMQGCTECAKFLRDAARMYTENNQPKEETSDGNAINACAGL